MSELTEDEKIALRVFRDLGPRPHPHFDLVEEFRPVVDELIRKGFIVQMWDISEAGENALRQMQRE